MPLPEQFAAQPLIEMLSKQEAVFIEHDPYLPTVAEATLSASQKRTVIVLGNLIKPLVENVPYIFSEERRGKLIQDVVERRVKARIPMS